MKRKIDHLVYCVPNIEQAIEDLGTRMSVKAIIGGKHLTQGTKNALINLGNECYLEILAIDEYNTKFKSSRWMGIDILSDSKITRWALKSNDIQKDAIHLNQYNPSMGNITNGSRLISDGNTLSWQIAMPLPGPEVELVPFITDWSKSESHPTDNLSHECKLLELILTHPSPNNTQELFNKMGIEITINKSKSTSIKAKIQTPNGIIEL